MNAAVLGLTQVLKKLIPEKYASKLTPLLAVFVGAGANVYLVGYSPENLFVGVVFGLMASGLYDLRK